MKYLKIKALEKNQWYDKDVILLHAAFQVLVDFMEKEKPGEIVDWSENEVHANAWKEMQELYHWYVKERPARVDPLDDPNLKFPPLEFEDVPGKPNLKMLVEYDHEEYADYRAALEKCWELENEWNKEDQDNLHRLIEIRLFLWT
jgi:hypothetical protein